MSLDSLLHQISKCRECEKYLEHGINPVLSVSAKSNILIIGQAPGIVVHRTGIPWDDKSGIRLREWLGVSNEEFYNPDIFGILPMGFCYPGKGTSGDLPPRKECAPLWHDQILNHLDDVRLILLIGQYAQHYYLKDKKRTLTDTVKSFQEYLPQFLPLPHPSPRNNIWLKKNPWFSKEVLPFLKDEVKAAIG